MTELNTELENIKKLASKIEDMSTAVGVIKKDGTNKHSNYKFTSHEATTERIRELLPEHKLGIIPSCKNYEERDYLTDKGKNGVRTVVTMEFEVIDLETGFSKKIPFFGGENDTGGKSMQQAITQATKYFYFKIFKIPFGDDGDSKTSEAGERYDSNKPYWNDYDTRTGEWKEETRVALLDMKSKGKTDDQILKEVQLKYQVPKQKQEALKELLK